MRRPPQHGVYHHSFLDNQDYYYQSMKFYQELENENKRIKWLATAKAHEIVKRECFETSVQALLDAQTAKFEQEMTVRNARFQKELAAELQEIQELLALTQPIPSFTMD